MPEKRLLLISNSINYGATFLEHATEAIKDFLGQAVQTVLFIPFASVRFSYDDYVQRVRPHFEGMGYGLESVHTSANALEAVRGAQALVAGVPGRTLPAPALKRPTTCPSLSHRVLAP
jgi:dipeptidase E